MNPQVERTKSEELLLFLFTTVILSPLLAIAIVGSYGFVVWMAQVLIGPPGS